jgi:hypothetical protein
MTTMSTRSAKGRAAAPPKERIKERVKPPAKEPQAPKAAPAPPRGKSAPRAAAPPRTPFVLLVVALLSGALVSLLLLNTVLAQDAFTLTRLQQSTKQLEQQRQEYAADNAREDSPDNLARKAKALGMVQPTQPAFIDVPSGQVVGRAVRPVPHPAAAAAGAAGVIGVPGAVVPGDGVPAPEGAP